MDKKQIQILQIEENDQPSQGVLIEQEGQPQFRTIEEKIEELNIDEVLHFNLIPDYQEPTDSLYPFVSKTCLGFYCLDGWHLIERAKTEGKNIVTCHVDYIEGHCDEELALRKVALRVRPKAGTGSYSETTRNTKRLEEILLASDKDLKLFHHGGNRKTEEFTNAQHQNVRQVLCFRLGKSITTINQYLNHGEFLSSDILNFFAENGVEKDFFEKAQPNKRWQINIFRDQRLNDDETTFQISNFMLQWYEEFIKDENIKPVWSETAEITKHEDNELSEIVPQSSPTEGSHEKISIAQSQDPEVSHEMPSHNYIDTNIESSPVDHQEPNISEETHSFEHIKLDIESLSKQLHEANSLSDLNLYFDQVMMAAKTFAVCIQALRALKTNNS